MSDDNSSPHHQDDDVSGDTPQHSHLILSPTEWRQLKKIRDMLEPFATLSHLIEGEKYCTISRALPSLKTLVASLKKLHNDADVKVTAVSMLVDIETRFDSILNPLSVDFDPTYHMATVLDPQCTVLIRGNLREDVKKWILSELSISNECQTFELPDAIAAEQSEEIPEHLKHFALILEEAKTAAHEETPATSQGQSADESFTLLEQEVKSAVDSVLKAGQLPQPLDTFQFWESSRKQFPTVAPFALDLLVVPGTSAPSERVFSHCSDVLGTRRHSLSHRNLEIETMCRVNAFLLL